MSPLTDGYFRCWAHYDLLFDGSDTLASCLIEANDVVWMNPDQLATVKKLAASRMGIYEHVGFNGPHVRLRELITETQFTCHTTSSYRGHSGELWYTRILPPLLPGLADYSIAYSPYILIEASKADWTQFLKRGISQAEFGNDKDGLRRFLKYGTEQNYWNEFVFKSYHHHQSDAIFLAGIPDLKATLPHS